MGGLINRKIVVEKIIKKNINKTRLKLIIDYSLNEHNDNLGGQR